MSLKLNEQWRGKALPAAVLIIAGINAGAVWYGNARTGRPHAKLVYTAQGFGGYTQAIRTPVHKAESSRSAVRDPIEVIQTAYDAGQYEPAQSAAQAFIDKSASHSHVRIDPGNIATARQILAYSAARQHDLSTARDQFARLQKEAAALPGHGRQAGAPGEVTPTLEAEAAYQHAVCTAALGDKPAAEVEYVVFMKRYPDSPLLPAAMKRIQWMHNGTMPPAATDVWKRSQAIASKMERTAARKSALCGPECLAELLRRSGTSGAVPAIADDMGTDASGTTLSQFAHTAGRMGIQLEGVALTDRGLQSRKLPLVALLKRGHYVLVDAITNKDVSIWDPDGLGTGRPQHQILSLNTWHRSWSGLALASPAAASSRTQDIKG